MGVCSHCSRDVPLKNKYCSNRCQAFKQYKDYIQAWKKSDANGLRGHHAITISRHVRRYILEKYDYRCCLCDWSGKNPNTGLWCLEVDHIDGNMLNCNETNLRLLCPNCHSMTSNYRGLNRGKGREWRRNKYVKE